jgi:N-acetylglucosaminyl-diphospho-decaprenol L-rhamnosyltransferase
VIDKVISARKENMDPITIFIQKESADKMPFVGIALAVHNRSDRTRECIEAVYRSQYKNIFICVVDDGSTDDTWAILEQEFPIVNRIRGDGTLWWGGATNVAIKSCLDAGCDYVLLLNPDCIVNPDAILRLVEAGLDMPEAVIASCVTDISQPEKVWWAGSIWQPINSFPFIWLLRHRYKPGTSINDLPDHPFPTSDFTGRAVLIPGTIFKKFGLIDEKTFPQYGGDNEFGLRITSGGGVAVVCPQAVSMVYVQETGQNVHVRYSNLFVQYINRLFNKKHGEVARCWWHLLLRYAPLYALVPSLFAVCIITLLTLVRSAYLEKIDA